MHSSRNIHRPNAIDVSGISVRVIKLGITALYHRSEFGRTKYAIATLVLSIILSTAGSHLQLLTPPRSGVYGVYTDVLYTIVLHPLRLCIRYTQASDFPLG